MVGIDSNILIYAHHREAAEFPVASILLRNLCEGDLPFAVAWASIYEFLRAATHPMLFYKPFSTAEILGEVSELLRSPAIRVVGPGPRHWAIASKMLAPIQPIARAAFDVQIAATLLEAGVSTIYTRDKAFESYGLKVLNPFGPKR